MKVAFSRKKPHKNSPIIFPHISRMNPVLTLLLEEIDRSFRWMEKKYQAKQSSGRIPFTQLIQVSAGIEQAYTVLETIESDSKEDDAEIDDASSSSDDFRFLEDEEIGSSSSSNDQETDDLDVDELTDEDC